MYRRVFPSKASILHKGRFHFRFVSGEVARGSFEDALFFHKFLPTLHAPKSFGSTLIFWSVSTGGMVFIVPQKKRLTSAEGQGHKTAINQEGT